MLLNKVYQYNPFVYESGEVIMMKGQAIYRREKASWTLTRSGGKKFENLTLRHSLNLECGVI